MTFFENINNYLSSSKKNEEVIASLSSSTRGSTDRVGLRKEVDRGTGNEVIKFLDNSVGRKGVKDQNTFYIATKSEYDTKYTLLEFKKIGDKTFSYTSPTNQKFQITFREGVGVNQQFSAALPTGYRIYGLSFPVSNAYAGTYKTNEPYSFVSYIPYEPMLDTLEKRKNDLSTLVLDFGKHMRR